MNRRIYVKADGVVTQYDIPRRSDAPGAGSRIDGVNLRIYSFDGTTYRAIPLLSTDTIDSATGAAAAPADRAPSVLAVQRAINAARLAVLAEIPEVEGSQVGVFHSTKIVANIDNEFPERFGNEIGVEGDIGFGLTLFFDQHGVLGNTRLWIVRKSDTGWPAFTNRSRSELTFAHDVAACIVSLIQDSNGVVRAARINSSDTTTNLRGLTAAEVTQIAGSIQRVEFVGGELVIAKADGSEIRIPLGISTSIADGSITTEKIRDGAVTREKLDPNIQLGGSGEVTDGSISTDKLADESVTKPKLSTGVQNAVTNAETIIMETFGRTHTIPAHIWHPVNNSGQYNFFTHTWVTNPTAS